MDRYHGTLLTSSQRGHRRRIFPSQSVLDHRAMTSVHWLRTLWDEDPELDAALQTGLLYLQFDDYRQNALPSVAYGRAIGSDSVVGLIPDTYFFESHGYAATRAAIASGSLPKWADRKTAVFWRGTATHDNRSLAGSPPQDPSEIPRVALCLALQTAHRADVGIRPWHTGNPPPSAVEQFIEAAGLAKPLVPMLQHAEFKVQIDIDGVANAWGCFDKLLMGSCLLKVASPYEQWFYTELKPWIHFVPIRNDLSDLHEKLDWCFSNDREAEEIGRQGQALALAHTFDRGLAIGRKAIRTAFIAFEPEQTMRSVAPASIRRPPVLFPAGPDLLLLDFGDRRTAEFLGEGWGGHEETWTWATGDSSTLHLGAIGFTMDSVLFLEVEPLFDEELRPSQTLRVVVNGTVVAEFKTHSLLPHTLKCRVPGHVLAARKTLTIVLQHPDWMRPLDFIEGANDQRKLSFKCREFRLQQLTPAFKKDLQAIEDGLERPITSALDDGFRGAGVAFREILPTFESLGLNCEFGFVQRKAGLEPLSLLRFNGLPFRKLVRGLRENFRRIAEAGSLRVAVFQGLEDQGYMGLDRNYEMIYHTERRPGTVSEEELLSVESTRLAYLTRKLIEDLEDGEKIFVLKSDASLHVEEVTSLIATLKEKGDNIVLWVVEADGEHPAGGVDLVTRNLMRGFVGRFADLRLGTGNIAYGDWEQMLRNAFILEAAARRLDEPVAV